MKLSKFEWGVLTGAITGIILIVILANITANEIKKVGLKSIVDNIWCGENGCD